MPPLVYETVAWLRFYSCLPLPALPGEGETGVLPDPLRAPHAAAIAGALIGAAGGVLLVLASGLGASAFVAAALALLLIVVLTCGRAEAALAEVAEKFDGVPTPDEARVGTRLVGYGVVAVVLAVLLRVGAIEGLTFHDAWRAAFALIAAGAVGRAAVMTFTLIRPAANEAGAAIAAETDKSALQWIAVYGLAIAVVAVLPSYGIGAVIAGLAAAAGAVALVTAFMPRNAFNGNRGSVHAAELVAEIAFLVAVLSFAGHSSSV